MQILLVEDDSTIARELQLRWTARGWSALSCSRLSEASQPDAMGNCDVVVLDLGLPDGDGLQWLEWLRQHDRKKPVLILTARGNVADRVEGLRSGADDYLAKPFEAEELDARLEVLERRVRMDRGERAKFGPLVWMQDEGRALLHGRPLELLPREFELLGLLVRRAPRLVPKRAIVNALAERNLEIGESAAELYISRLRRKLAGSGMTIQTVRGFGYMLKIDADGPDEPCDRQ